MKNFDPKLPRYTGNVGFVVANTFLTMNQEDPSPYKMDFARMNLLLFTANTYSRRICRDTFFIEPFIMLRIDEVPIPVLTTIAALYGTYDPVFITNAKGTVVVIDHTTEHPAAEVLRKVWQDTKDKSNQEIMDMLRKINAIRPIMTSGYIIPC